MTDQLDKKSPESTANDLPMSKAAKTATSMSIDELNARFEQTKAKQQEQVDPNHQAWIEKMQKAGHKPNYQSLVKRNFQMYKYKMPTSGSDQAYAPDLPYGAGEWDYIQANKSQLKLGPKGQQLPPGAKGWNAQGEAWYGTNNAFSEWAKAFANNVFKDSGQKYQEWINKRFTLSGDDYQQYMQSIGGERPKNEQSFIKTSGKFIWQSINGVLTLAQGTAEGVERIVGAGDALEAVAAQSNLPDMKVDLTPDLTPKDVANMPKWAQKPTLFVANFLDAFDVVELSWDSLRSATVLFSNDPKKKQTGWATLKDNLSAGKMAYSNWINPAAKEEFIRRLNQGESEWLLRRELENPWAEMAGELILDPLNFVGALTKGSKTAKVAKTSLTQVIANVGEDVAAAAHNLDNIQDTANATDFAYAVMNRSNELISDLESLSHQTTVRSLTTSGSQAHMNDIVGQYIGNLASNLQYASDAPGVSKVDEAMSIMSDILDLSSDNIDEVTTAVGHLGSTLKEHNLPYELLFGDGALQTSRILREMGGIDNIGKLEKILKNGEASAKTIEEFIHAFDEITRRATKKLFPTLAERAAAGEKLNTTGQALLRVENFANSGPMRGINSFFAHVYMGMSPGYAFRNLITNTLHILVDEGFGVFTANGKVKLFDINSVSDDIVAKLGHLPHPAERALGPLGEFRKDTFFSKYFGWSLRMGQEFERRSSLRVFNASLKRTFNAMLQPGRAIPDIAPLLEAGMANDTARFLQKTLVNTQGDVKQAMKIFRTAMADGSIDLFAHMGWIDDITLEALRRTDIEQPFRNLITEIANNPNSTLEEAQAAKDAIFEALKNEAAKVTQEAGSYTPGGPHMNTIETLVKNANLDDAALDTVHKQMQSNLLVKEQIDRLTHLLDDAAKVGGIDMEKALMNHPQGAFIHSLLRNEFWPSAQAYSQTNIEEALALTRKARARGFETGEDLWKFAHLPGNAPKGITVQQALNFYWEGFWRPKMRNYWANVREVHSSLTNELLNVVVNNMPDNAPKNAMTFLEDALTHMTDKVGPYLERARVWDAGEVENGVNYLYGSNMINDFDEMLRMAAINGVGAGGEKGTGVAPNLANILRKHAPKDVLEKITTETTKYAYKGRNIEPKLLETIQRLGKDATEADYEKITKLIDTLIEGNYAGTGFTQADSLAQKKRELQLIAEEITRMAETKAGKPLEEITHRDFTLDQVRTILQDYFGKDFKTWNGMPENSGVFVQDLFAEIGQKADELMRIPTPENTDVPMSLGRGFWNMREELDWLQERLGRKMALNWGKRGEMRFQGDVEGALKAWEAEAVKRTTRMRMKGTEIATHARDFALLNYYERHNSDTIMSMIYPYGFWYKGTYQNWIKRIAQNPGTIAAYAKYREAMETAHAGQPDWWKYNVNTNELLGLDSKNPLFFNLEATLNPLNGLTGVDFEDKYKLVNGWTQFLNDLNRFGPSTHTMFSVATALNLYRNGQKDAAARWAGRLIPATNTLNALSSVLGFGPKETDPFVIMFSDGIDPYTRRRVQRALAQMQMEGMITEEQAIDAARNQKGDIWDVAHERAVTERAPGQLSSYLLGVGFKARNLADLATDQMYQDYFRILSMRDNLSPEEFRIQLDQLHEQYPMMNTVLISDNSEYAYNVLGRIPPGESSAFYEIAGMNKEVVNQFYQMKGDMSSWSEGDRERFLAGIVDLGAILAIPSNATRQEWTAVRNEYTQLNNYLKQTFSPDIQDKMDTYFGLYRQNKQFAREYLQMNPDVSEALDYKAGTIATNPQGLLATYYGGLEQIENYYKGQMYDDAEQQFTKEIFQTEANYWSFATSAERKQYLRQHPELKAYWDMKHQYQVDINQKVVELGSLLQEPKGIEFRKDVQGVGIGAQQMIEQIQNQRDPLAGLTIQQWTDYVGSEVVDIAVDALRNQRQLSYREQQMLNKAAEKVGLADANELIQRIGLSAQ